MPLGTPPLAIVINGTSSAGKTTVARMLLEALDDQRPVYISVDTFASMLPSRLVGEGDEAKSGFYYFKSDCGLEIGFGQQGQFMIDRMHDFAGNVLVNGSSVVIDHVLLSDTWAHQLERLGQTGARVLSVLVTCDQGELDKREKQRSDRQIGLAAGLRHVEDKIKRYGLVIDNTTLTREETLNVILDYLRKVGIGTRT